MGAQEVFKIKQYQRDFEQKFGKKLYISWPEMKGVVPRISVDEIEKEDVTVDLTQEEILIEVVTKHNTTLEAIRDRSKRVHVGPRKNERRALIEFSKIIVTNRMHMGDASKLINRDRSTLYHFAKLADAPEM